MKRKRLRFDKGFRVAFGNRAAQAADMVLAIERGEFHGIANTGRSLLKTLNIYVPPAYTNSGDELPRGRK